jgi:hypothetical protein
MLSDGSLAETDAVAFCKALGFLVDRHHSTYLQHCTVLYHGSIRTRCPDRVWTPLHTVPPRQARLSRCAACIQRILRERRDDMQHASAGRLQHDSRRAAEKCGLGQSARFSDQRSCSRNAALDQRIDRPLTQQSLQYQTIQLHEMQYGTYARWRRQRD